MNKETFFLSIKRINNRSKWRIFLSYSWSEGLLQQAIGLKQQCVVPEKLTVCSTPCGPSGLDVLVAFQDFNGCQVFRGKISDRIQTMLA